MDSFLKEIERQQQMIENDPAMRNLAFGVQMVFIIIGAIAAIWVANDARKHGMNSFAWGACVFLMWFLFGIIGGPIAMAIYFWRRKTKVMALMTVTPPSVPAGSGPTCTSCGRINPAGARFCSHCGSTIQPETQPSEKVCSGCGEKNPSTNRFCTNCGKEL